MKSIYLHQFAEKLELRGYAPRSAELYTYEFSRFLRYLAEHENTQSPLEVIPEHFTAYHNHLRYEPNKKGAFLKGSTIYKRLSAVKLFYQVMHEDGVIHQDYSHAVTMPKMKKGLPRNVPTEEEMQTLLDSVTEQTPIGIRNRCILEVLYGAGLRNEELRILTIEDIDLAEKTVFVHGKGSKDRIVPLGHWLIKWLVEYLEHARQRLVTKKTEDGLVFLSRYGTPLSSVTLNEIVRTTTEKAELTHKLTPHSLRHAFATHLLKHGADIRVIQELLGHGSLQSTQVYTHIDITYLKKAHARYHPRERGNGAD